VWFKDHFLRCNDRAALVKGWLPAPLVRSRGHASVPLSNRALLSGRVDDSLDDFLEEYEELAKDGRLSEQQKCKTVLCYIAPTHRDLWKSLDEFHLSDWTGFCQALSRVYESTSTQGRYSQQKPSEFIKTAAKTHKTEEDDILQYYRRFLILSKPLLELMCTLQAALHR